MPARAHPHDRPGKQILQQIAELTSDPRFSGKIVFVEDYDINVGRHLVQGVDVWLNNPRRPLEASGTSGQKVVLNGGLNLSILDGWWAEAYDGFNGFAIGMGETHTAVETHDANDLQGLLTALKNEVVPALLQARPRWLAARLDQTHEAGDSDNGVALQLGSDGEGLCAEVVHSGRRWDE